jgi:hypothetical protein
MRGQKMATWDVQANYGDGWDTVMAEETEEQAYETMNTYRENEPGVRFRVKLDPYDGQEDINFETVIRYLNV